MRIRLRLRPLFQILILAFVVQVFVIPQIGGAREALDTVASVSPLLIAAALVLEVAAIVAYAQLTRLLLDVEPVPSLTTSLGVVLASLGVNHVVPGGAATTAAVNYRLFGKAGVPRAELGFALATQAVGSAVVLNVILWVALVLSIPATGFDPLYATAAGVGAVLMSLFSLAVLTLLRGQDSLASWAGRLADRIPRLDRVQVEQTVRQVAGQLRQLVTDRERLKMGVALAAANWLLDAAALWVCLTAFGHRPGLIGLLVAYGLAYVLAAIPITPGGLGVVEAVLIPTLIGFDNPASVVAVGVVAYRLVNFWLPIPLGMASYFLVDRHFSTTGSSPGPIPIMTELLDARDAEMPD